MEPCNVCDHPRSWHSGSICDGKTCSCAGWQPGHAGIFVPAGALVVFGEMGPELGIPRAAIDIIPADMTRRILESKGSH